MKIKNLLFVASVLLVSSAHAMDDQIITLQSLDGQKLQVQVGVAKLSQTLQDLLQDAEIDEPLAVPNIQGVTLRTVLELLSFIKREDDLCATQNYIDATLSALTGDALLSFIAAVNYLDIPLLLQSAIEAAVRVQPSSLSTSLLLQLPKEIRNEIIAKQAMRIFGDTTAHITEANKNLKYVEMSLLTPDGQKLLVAFYGNGIGVFDVKTGQLLTVLSLPPLLKSNAKIANFMYVTPDSRTLIASFYDGNGTEDVHAEEIQKIYVWDLVNYNYKELASYRLDTDPDSQASFVTPDTKTLIVGLSDSLVLFDLASGKKINQVMYPPETLLTERDWRKETDRIYGTKDGSKLICGTTRGQIYIYDMHTLELLKKFEMPSLRKNDYFLTSGMYGSPDDYFLTTHMCVSPDEDRLFLLLSEGKASNRFFFTHSIIEFDLKSGDYRKIIDIGNGRLGPFSSFMVSSDGSKLIFADGSAIQIWDIASGTRLSELRVPYTSDRDRSSPLAVVLTPEGNTLISAEMMRYDRKGRLIKWDISPHILMQLMKNMSREQAAACLQNLQGDHAAGWNGLKKIFGLPIVQWPLVQGAEPVHKKIKRE